MIREKDMFSCLHIIQIPMHIFCDLLRALTAKWNAYLSSQQDCQLWTVCWFMRKFPIARSGHNLGFLIRCYQFDFFVSFLLLFMLFILLAFFFLARTTVTSEHVLQSMHTYIFIWVLTILKVRKYIVMFVVIVNIICKE